MAKLNMQQGLVLGMSTVAFTICFMIWMMFAVLGVPIKEIFQLNETQFGLLAATPVLTGSLVRLPLGMLTDKFGGRIVFFMLMLICVLPIYLISEATAYWHFLVLGLFVGLAGGSFSVGIAYVAKWFDKSNQGLAMGIFGAGNAGSALTKFIAPAIIAAGSWQMVPKVYSAIMFITALLFWFLTSENKAHRVASTVTLKSQLQALKDPAVWRYCQYYSIVFGGYVALALWMTKYYVQEYGFSLQAAALLAACFSLPGGVLRAVGGWMSDKWGAQSVTWWVMWVSWVCLFLLSYPQTDFTIQTVEGSRTFHIGLNAWVFTALMFIVGIAFAFGKASVFKYISDDYPENMGVISGIVGLAGGLGGFVLPIMFGALVDLTGVRSSAFMLLYGVVWVSLIWMYFSEVRKTPLMGKAGQGQQPSAS
ncbi:MAG: NarK/NasA family nitrate transporter [Pseudomonas sp.]|jgi:NNP family nitrate/nitrite transporter-like MFS transporter|uniref:NarK/NasA family nitrate transporter n=1 Tax=Stutzerimonas degradans TaxID=2968968 RepID=A0A4P9E070_9GAMM|nr:MULTISPECIES: nitrate/nitrite transporter [Pseudomonadaceae]MCF6751232.1 NarK/NasA family nitrate transporter [Stutzerimonas stutzeri]MDT3711162.1 nitrate/nitrite transporter [Pseudomonadaceae bacterium]MEB2325805.1 NarK/NasA family nitrate transporter [Pseudomonas sp.]KGK81294.1 major facilitator transporter [Stutzerimonas degradans]MCQ4232459.1 NarK/NasA family nitrate transporter [Stutzerimonas degradans]